MPGTKRIAFQTKFLSLYHYLADVLPYQVSRWDEKCLLTFSTHRALRPLSPLMIAATYAGDGYLWGIVALFILMFGTKSDYNHVLVGLSVTILNILFFRLLKIVFKRARPLYTAPVHDLKYRFLDSFSFPSGHATTSFGIAFVLSHYYPFFLIALLVYGVSSLIAISRIYVAEHYPSDVMSGAILGTITAQLFLPIFERMFRL
jgi:undecaprenyl-diphosphatase